MRPGDSPRLEDEGREGAVVTSGGGRIEGEGGASRRKVPGGVDPREDGDGRCRHLVFEIRLL